MRPTTKLISVAEIRSPPRKGFIQSHSGDDRNLGASQVCKVLTQSLSAILLAQINVAPTLPFNERFSEQRAFYEWPNW